MENNTRAMVVTPDLDCKACGGSGVNNVDGAFCYCMWDKVPFEFDGIYTFKSNKNFIKLKNERLKKYKQYRRKRNEHDKRKPPMTWSEPYPTRDTTSGPST